MDFMNEILAQQIINLIGLITVRVRIGAEASTKLSSY